MAVDTDRLNGEINSLTTSCFQHRIKPILGISIAIRLLEFRLLTAQTALPPSPGPALCGAARLSRNNLPQEKLICLLTPPS